MPFPSPPVPVFSPEQAVTADVLPRYEDCTQDGRLIPIAIPPALSTLWTERLAHHTGVKHGRAAGVIPLLTRLTVVSFDQPIRVQQPVEVAAGFELAHDRDEAGDVSRLHLNVWADVRGESGRSGAPRTGDAGRVLAGRVFGEHTFTRPFGPPEQRRVTSLAGLDGFPELPPARHSSLPAASAGDLPAAATWLEDSLAPDSVDVRFTLDQTDANQHVNSLVYIRCFLDAVQRRLADGGHPGQLRSKAVDIAYRKPSFAGDRVRAQLRLFAQGDGIGAAGFIAAPGEETRPRCYVRVLLGP